MGLPAPGHDPVENLRHEGLVARLALVAEVRPAAGQVEEPEGLRGPAPVSLQPQ